MAARSSANGCVHSDKTRNGYSNGISNLSNGLKSGARKNGLTINHTKENESNKNTKTIEPIDWSKIECYGGSYEKSSIWAAALTHLGLYFLMFLGYINQMLFTPKVATERNREGYAPLYNPFEQFYSRYVYRRVRHCFNRPITSSPGAVIKIKEWVTDDYNWTLRLTGKELECINLGSYNYLGFAGSLDGGVEAVTRKYGLSVCSPRNELGTTPLHLELEQTIADFLGVEAAMVFGMGFATNALGLPGLLGPEDLVLSDQHNHASLISGLRMARVTTRVFRHNDMKHLEELARKAISERKWKKIIIVVEGVYSMEGSIVPLPSLLEIKRRYKLFLYLDEAHSIGALGSRGRGVTDYFGVDSKEVDVLMGTFTKSFGAAGGYISGSRRLISWLRQQSHAESYAISMAPPVAEQVLSATKAIASEKGRDRLIRLKENTRHFRDRLSSMGVIVYGHPDSPVVPMLVFSFSKLTATVERLMQLGVATVGVGFPATALNEARIRFCLSSAHTREQLDRCLDAISQVVDELGLNYSRKLH